MTQPPSLPLHLSLSGEMVPHLCPCLAAGSGASPVSSSRSWLSAGSRYTRVLFGHARRILQLGQNLHISEANKLMLQREKLGPPTSCPREGSWVKTTRISETQAFSLMLCC